MNDSSHLFEQSYNDLVRHAKHRVHELRLNVDGEDLVNDAYIKLIESGEQFDYTSIKRSINYIAFKYGEHEKTETSFSEKPSAFVKLEGEIQCKKCHAVKHITEFPIIKLQAYSYPLHTCKECYKPVQKKNWTISNKTYREKNTSILSDIYIKHLLKTKGKNHTDEDIKQKKIEVSIIRGMKKSGALKQGDKKAKIKPKYADIPTDFFLKQCENARNIINSIRKVA